MINKSLVMSNYNLQAYIPMDEVIQYRKDQKASGGGRMVYKGIKLNNRTMHNFRPTIGRRDERGRAEPRQAWRILSAKIAEIL